jgi:hypothetical protein
VFQAGSYGSGSGSAVEDYFLMKTILKKLLYKLLRRKQFIGYDIAHGKDQSCMVLGYIKKGHIYIKEINFNTTK